MKYVVTTLGMSLLLVSFLGQADELTTDWIQPVSGFHENTLGTEIRAVEPIEETGETRIILSVPKESISEYGDIPEVVVVAKKPKKEQQPEIQIRHEWVSDYDNDNYGLVLYLGKDDQLPFRIYFKGLE